MNQKLSRAACASALSRCSTPLFLCDLHLHLCMLTPNFKQLFPRLILGKKLAEILPPDLREQLEEAPDNIRYITVSAGTESLRMLALSCDAGGEPCIVCLMHPIDPQLLHEDTDCVRLAYRQIREVTHDLLNTADTDIEQLSFACNRLTRMLSIANFTDPDSYTGKLTAGARTELIPFLNTTAAEFGGKFASAGASLTFSRTSVRSFYCRCASKCLGFMLVPLFTAAVCRSQDGRILLDADDRRTYPHGVEISVIVPTPAYRRPITCFDDLIEDLQTLRLDLLAVKDIAAFSGITVECADEDGRLVIRLNTAYTSHGDAAMHAPHITPDQFFLRTLFSQLFAECRAELPQIRDI